VNDNLDTPITVLMPVYNASLFLREAIESILNQTYKNFEFIIINDGSTDSSLQIIESFKDPRIKLVNNERNLGIIKTRNKGLQLAKGKYIANMDADDISLPTRLEKQFTFLEKNPDVAVIASKLVLINQNNDEIGIWPEDYHISDRNEIRKVLPIINCIGQPTVMIKNSVMKEIGYNSKYINGIEDWGLWLDILSNNYIIEKLDDVLLRYRIHSNSITVSGNLSGVKNRIILFKLNYIKYNFFKLNFIVFKLIRSLSIDVIKFSLESSFPRFYMVLIALIKLNKTNFIKQYFAAKKLFNTIQYKVPVVYFFPSFHTGGADRVHASILEAVNQKNSLTIITSKSDNDTFYKQFSQYSNVLEVYDLIKLEFGKRWIYKKMNNIYSVNSSVNFFGCNSEFFYETIPHLPNHANYIDLIHAFVHKYESGPEKWSLPYINRLKNRIVINQKTKSDFIEFYKKNQISDSFLSNIVTIPNFVESQNQLPQKENNIFKIGFVGRGSEEKRVDLIAKLANKMLNKNSAIQFHFVGDVKWAIPLDLQKSCIFHGVVSDEQQLQKLYKEFHVILIASSREGFPMVIMEGMMNGAVPVSTNVGGISEHVIPNENGYLLNSISEIDIMNEFEEKLNYLNNNRAELLKLSSKAHQYALTHFSKEHFFKSYSTLLNTHLID
jgi:glycosyltransferase involved in cell wall biosynthesis